MKKTLLLLLVLWITVPAFCCTSVIIGADASANGRPLLWKHRDSPAKYNYVDFFEAHDGCYSFTGVVNSVDSLRKEVWCGTNEKGFSIINTVAYGLSPIYDEERPWEGIVMKRALEICVTIEDFEAYIKSLPQPNGLETNIGVSDANGDAAYFEVHDLGYTRFDVPRNGYLIRTNYAMTGREGEGMGYDRYELVEAKMKAHEGKFDVQWIYDELSREDIIARPTSLSSVILDGEVLWCESGYSRCCYPIPVWVAAKDLIPSPLRYADRQGSLANIWAEMLKTATRDTEYEFLIDGMVEKMEGKEFKAFDKVQKVLAKRGFSSSIIARYNDKSDRRFKKFTKKSYLCIFNTI